jgi:HSP20 family protein
VKKMTQARQKMFANSAVGLEKMELKQLHQRVERLYSILQEALELEELNSPNAFSPPIDLCETSDAVCISVEVPGLSPEDINLVVTAKDLTIEGIKKHSPNTQKAISHFRCERQYGKFQRKIQLHWAINIKETTSSLKNGTLTIYLPKLKDRRGKSVKIPIEVEE